MGDSELPVTGSFYVNTMGVLGHPYPTRTWDVGAYGQEQETGPESLGQNPHPLTPEGGEPA